MGRRLRIGEDILLARHGKNIRSLSYDRRSNSMVAILSDGSRDAVSNVISTTPVPRVDDQSTVIAPPVVELASAAGSARSEKPALDAEDKKILVWTGAIGLGLSIALAVAFTAAGSALGDDALQRLAMTVPMY